MRQHIFVTGPPGVGKSTLIHRVLDQLNLTGQPAGAVLQPVAIGFYNEEVRAGGERRGFDVVTLDGQRGPLARTGTAHRGAAVVGKYVVDVAAFEALALPAIRATLESTRLVVIDEVGKMELFSSSFYPAVQQALDNQRVVVFGSVPVPRYGRTIPQVEALKSRPDVTVITVSRDNRDQLVATISSQLQQAMQQLLSSST